MNPGRDVGLAIGVGLFAWVALCWVPTGAAGPPSGPSRIVVLFDVDTLRADRLGTYGYPLATSPNLDRLAADGGLVAEHAITSAGWTLPAHASIFSSLPVSAHGVRTALQAVPRDVPLLAEILARHGVLCRAITASGYVDARFGFGRGFESYAFYGFAWHQASGEARDALRLVDEAGEGPLFLFLHTIQVHNRMPTERGARGVFGSTKPLGPRWDEALPVPATTLGPKAAREITSFISARYDASIRETDESLGELVAGLTARGLWDRTAVVFTSDHGEELGERPVRLARSAPAWGHTVPYLYEEHIHIPLVVRAPWRKDLRGRIAPLVSSLDIAPTILDLFDVAIPPGMEGTPLARLGSKRRVVVSEASPYGAIAVLEGTHKLIARPGFRTRHWETGEWLDDLPAEECFDLAADPGERHGTSCAEPWGKALRREAERYVAASLSGEVVVRAEPRGDPCRLEIAGSDASGVRFFGEPPGARESNAGAVERLELGRVAGPVWLGIPPAGGDRGISLSLAGCGGVRTAAGRELPLLSEPSLSELLWRGAGPLPDGTVVFVTAPERETRSEEAAYTPELEARLRSLGYVSPQVSVRPPARSTPLVPRELLPPAGSVRIHVEP